MFCIFVTLDHGITYWAASRTRPPPTSIPPAAASPVFQNGLAIAGDHVGRDAARSDRHGSHPGCDGYIYMLAFFAGWPIILFLMAERLRNLGRFTFSDITAYRLDRGKVRTMAAVRRSPWCASPHRADGRRRPAHQAALFGWTTTSPSSPSAS